MGAVEDPEDGWDERTEAIPGTKGDKSFELDFDFASSEGPPEQEPTLAVSRASLVVFEPSALGLAGALEKMGYAVRSGSTGVDVMGLVAGQQPAAVVCAPAPDAERRRLLAAALRLRFPTVPVLYVSTHAKQEEAVLGAIREGARAVLAWPLPPAADVARVLAPYIEARRPITNTVARAPASEESDDDDFGDARTLVTERAPSRMSVPAPIPSLPLDAMRPLPDGLEEPTTQPNMRPAASAAVEAIGEKRGEIGQLLRAVSPFLWSLEDAARWADGLAAQGDSTAGNHARALHLLAKILAQLQSRIDDTGA